MSKFSGLRSARLLEQDQQSNISPTQKSAGPEKKLGRPPAKRSDPAYTQVTAYIRKDTYLAVKRKLLDQENREFSDALEELLHKWVTS